MKREGDTIILSASDLMRFQVCQHATTLDLAWLQRRDGNDGGIGPAADDESAKLLQAKGDAHERSFLAELKAAGVSVEEIETKRAPFADASAMTLAALKAGRPIVYQAAMAGGAWAGYADFLERVERPSRLGSFSYEVIDTKLKRSPSPSHVLQLALYSDLLRDIQGISPEHIHVVLGDSKRATLRLGDYIYYARRLRHRLEGFIADPPATRPEPSTACALCRWKARCQHDWDTGDSLTLVAGIRRSQRAKLEAAGVATLGQLAERKLPVPDLAPEVLNRLRIQARLQHARRAGGPPAFELREDVEDGTGFARMPKPTQADLFFDMEGDPLIEGGLEYLFGIYHEADGEGRFEAIWAHDHAAERDATLAVLTLFADHIAAHPGAFIYHYNHYEVTALKRLAMKHGVGEGILDDLLRDRRFVDLYRVVQQGMLASEPGYSLKDLEAFYAAKRTEDVTSAGDSIVVYEKWCETQERALLDGIRAYNEFDCKSTKGLRDWIVRSVRPKDLPWASRTRTIDERRATDERVEAEEAQREATRKLLSGVAGSMRGAPAELLFELMSFHRREDKPQWWAVFDHAEWETAELIDDLDSLGGLVAHGPVWPEKQSLARTYRFPEQETKLRDGATPKAKIEGQPNVTAMRLDMKLCEADVKFGPKAGSPPDALDLIPGGPIKSEVLRAAIARVAGDVFDGGGSYPAIEVILQRAAPSIIGVKSGQPIIGGDTPLVEATIDVVRHMQSTCLPIQGPPGTGKTYVASHAILALVRAGNRVAVTAHSHKAIDNLLLAVAKRAKESTFQLQAIKKSDDGDALAAANIAVTSKPDDARLTTFRLVGGTAWLFARGEHDQTFDYLVVDEAGQFSLANLVAAGTCARNIVLVGDPMQLAQPIQGVHPGQSGASALGHILGEAATIAPERGIFLPTSRRMHPAICGYISDVVYEGRLASDEDAAKQALLLDKPRAKLFPSAGLRFIPVVHDGNSQSSEEEAAAVRKAYVDLVGQHFRDRDGKSRKITIADVLVVSPYNAQVNLLARTLPSGARVGTVDKFQGQEAPVCIVSMATSSAEEMPRNIEFLFSVNRLNVAISRAQALSIVIASPRLLDVPCSSIEQMRLVNALCAVEAYSAKMDPKDK